MFYKDRKNTKKTQYIQISKAPFMFTFIMYQHNNDIVDLLPLWKYKT